MAVVGHEQLLQGDALTECIDPYELWEVEGKRRMPSLVVRLRSIEELQLVRAIANAYAILLRLSLRGKTLG
jgi:hypothetical protein